jgi:AraC-like DNA-binding protein
MFIRSSGVDAPPPLDPLSDVLQDVQLTDVLPGYATLTHPWGVAFAPRNSPQYHFVASGPCWVGSTDGEWIALEPGDAMLLPRQVGHVVSSVQGGATTPFEEMSRESLGETTDRVHDNGDGVTTKLFCCRVTFKGPGIEHLLDLMPPMLLLRGAAKHDPVLPALLETMAAEIRDERMGSATVLSRLADVVVTRVVRAWAEEHREDAVGWLAAIHDPKIGRALAAIHRRPGQDWSIEALAGVACASRSVFTERFAQLVGVTPARYLARVRMRIASDLLHSDGLGVRDVAERLGYESEASFSRAFKRHIGVSPSAFRRSGQSEPARARVSP